ncbi:MAG TPA: flagellar export chaperone FliS [Holophaga sp.]|nr:flagellar export chaperone FliS [Holophaga sp.]
MQGYGGEKAADQYLVQRIQGASPEQLVAMLLEGGQRFIGLVLQAMKDHDLPNQARYVNRVSDIIVGLRERLNFDDGGELVENLARIYDWWMNELFDGAMKGEPERLQRISGQMGEFKETWEELHRRKTSGGQAPNPTSALGELSI